MPQRNGRGSAPQEQSDWYNRRGHAEIRLFKTDHQFEIRSSLSSSLFNHLLVTDDLEAPLDTRFLTSG